MNKPHPMDYKVKAFRNSTGTLYFIAHDKITDKYRSLYIGGDGEISITLEEYESIEDCRKYRPEAEQIFDMHITIPNYVGPK